MGSYVAFCVWLLSLSIMFSRFTHVNSLYQYLVLLPSNVALYGYSIFCLSIHELRYMQSYVEDLPTCFPKQPHSSVHSHQPCLRAPISLHPHQHLGSSVCLIIAILVGAKRNLAEFWICGSLMTNLLSFFSYAYWPSVYFL